MDYGIFFNNPKYLRNSVVITNETHDSCKITKYGVQHFLEQPEYTSTLKQTA
jgi:hypothetical protein